MCVLTVLKPLLTFHSLLESIRCETFVNLSQFIGKYTLFQSG